MLRPYRPCLLLGAAAAMLLLAGATAGTSAAVEPATAHPAADARPVATGARKKALRVPRSFIGVVSDDALWGTPADPSGGRTMAAIRRMGAGAVRVAFLWERIEPAPGRYDFDLYDAFMTQAARHGLSVLPVLFDPPRFRSSRPASGARPGTYPPANNQDFARFATAVVQRYGSRGSFWRARPHLSHRPIRAWQVWNEPNLRQYWPAGPNPAAYAAMLRAVGPAIRGADPSAEVVTAGLPDSPTGMPLGQFLRGMYRAGARGSFTALGLQPYAPTPRQVIAQIRKARTIMRRNGDRAAVRVTEIGWATGGPGRKPVSEGAQARLLRQTVARLVRARRTLRLTGVTIFNWRDAPPYAGGHDFWGLHAGLHTQDGRPKPVVSVLSRLLRLVVRG